MKKKIKFRLQGHEKFVLREGWLSKGLKQVAANPAVFLDKEAPDIFGIGNNMVKSLRYWLKALGLTDERTGELTNHGQLIYKYDPYFESIFTLWILHSNIVKNSREATTWYLFFNMCYIDELDKEGIVQILIRELKKHIGNSTFSEKSLRNDVDVLLSMYGKVKEITDPEDKNISPFAQLDLIKNTDGSYSKRQPDRRKISEWVLLFEIAGRLTDRSYVSIDEISEGVGSINSVYQINSVTISEYLDRLDALGYVRVDRTAGLDMIYRVSDLSQEKVIEDFYENHR